MLPFGVIPVESSLQPLVGPPQRHVRVNESFDGNCHPAENNAVQMRARETAMAIRSVILAAGRPVSVAEIAEATGMPPKFVMRRLQTNGNSNINSAFAWFACGPDGWGLTARGLELSERG